MQLVCLEIMGGEVGIFLRDNGIDNYDSCYLGMAVHLCVIWDITTYLTQKDYIPEHMESTLFTYICII